MTKSMQERQEIEDRRKLQLAATLRGMRKAYCDRDFCVKEMTAIFAKYKHPDAIPIHNRIIEEIEALCPDTNRLLKAIAGAIRAVINETQSA